MKKIILFLTVLLVLFSIPSVYAQTVASPNSIAAPKDRQSTWHITWSMREFATPPTPPDPRSLQGVFSNGLGPVNTVVSAVQTGSGVGYTDFTGREVLTISSSVIKRAEQAGITSFNYIRTFSGIGGPSGTLTINLTSAAGGELNISRIRLYFKNQRGEITVNRNEKGLKTFADINYTGKGFLKGYWQVDNRVISYVNKPLIYGKKLTIETPDIPNLPTFIEGTHEVKFIIQSPDLQGFTMPKAIYYVRPFAAIQIIPIAQKDPYNMAPVDYSPLTLTWGEKEDLETYLIEFMDIYNKDPMFSAYTKIPEYTMPPYVLKHYFKASKRYYWKVKGFNPEDNIAGESPIREFRFKAE